MPAVPLARRDLSKEAHHKRIHWCIGRLAASTPIFQHHPAKPISLHLDHSFVTPLHPSTPCRSNTPNRRSNPRYPASSGLKLDPSASTLLIRLQPIRSISLDDSTTQRPSSGTREERFVTPLPNDDPATRHTSRRSITHYDIPRRSPDEARMSIKRAEGEESGHPHQRLQLLYSSTTNPTTQPTTQWLPPRSPLTLVSDAPMPRPSSLSPCPPTTPAPNYFSHLAYYHQSCISPHTQRPITS